MPEFSLRALTWLPRDHGDRDDRATHAEVEIVAAGTCLTEVADRAASSVRPGVRVSAAALAGWLLQNRWRILYEPAGRGTSDDWAMSHQLGAIGGGFAWPDVTLSSDGERLRVEARPAGGPEDMVRTLNAATVDLSLDAFDRAVDPFVEQVVARLEALGLHDSALVALARDIRNERSDGALDRFRVAEAVLGLDPDEADADAIRRVTEQVAWTGESAASEILSELGYARAPEALPWIRGRESEPDVEVDLSALEPLVGCLAEGGLPWERGVSLARRVRSELGIGLARLDLDQVLGARLGEAAVELDRPLGLAVARAGSRRGGMTFRHRRPTSRRFEAARMIGDWLARPLSDVASPVTDRATSRQRLQRAFAAELLCPLEGLVARVSLPRPTDDEIEEAALYYDVSPFTVRNTLVNRRRVDRSYLPRS